MTTINPNTLNFAKNTATMRQAALASSVEELLGKEALNLSFLKPGTALFDPAKALVFFIQISIDFEKGLDFNERLDTVLKRTPEVAFANIPIPLKNSNGEEIQTALQYFLGNN